MHGARRYSAAACHQARAGRQTQPCHGRRQRALCPAGADGKVAEGEALLVVRASKEAAVEGAAARAARLAVVVAGGEA